MENLKDNLTSILDKIKEPFVSETDFQFHLAWELQKIYQDKADIILEFPIKEKKEEKQQYYDIAIKDKKSQEISFIELKYKTRKATITRHGVELELKNQGARDIGNYLFLKDISRLEKALKGNSENHKNYCIFLTNDKGYWEDTRKKDSTIDRNFKLYNGTKTCKEITWAGGTFWKGKYDPFKLDTEYACNWNKLQLQNITFQYLIIEITK